jgi:hypothetical protein
VLMSDLLYLGTQTYLYYIVILLWIFDF